MAENNVIQFVPRPNPNRPAFGQIERAIQEALDAEPKEKHPAFSDDVYLLPER